MQWRITKLVRSKMELKKKIKSKPKEPVIIKVSFFPCSLSFFFLIDSLISQIPRSIPRQVNKAGKGLFPSPETNCVAQLLSCIYWKRLLHQKYLLEMPPGQSTLPQPRLDFPWEALSWQKAKPSNVLCYYMLRASCPV